MRSLEAKIKKTMNIFKRKSKTSKLEEMKQFFPSLGKITFATDSLKFEDYPFDCSFVSTNPVLNIKDIINICVNSAPPTVKVDNELIFISAEHKQKLIDFAEKNNLPFSDRPALWDWILEPFLDTEFTAEDKERIYILLEKYELGRETVDKLRETVTEQMIKYNFETMLWEWTMFSALDVLNAMKPRLTPNEFKIFYKQVMEIALRPDRIDKKPSH